MNVLVDFMMNMYSFLAFGVEKHKFERKVHYDINI
jgi:hypothetical protein